jgi:mannose-6-phosphate isomerase-like protein (cupin superfamily)/pyrroloquinoline quinone (PQQ) biosynthesis protein C
MSSWLCDGLPLAEPCRVPSLDGAGEDDDSVPPTSRSAAIEAHRRAEGAPRPDDALARLRLLQADHPFWHNRLFQACAAGALTRDDYRVLFSQYYLYSRTFTRYLAALMAKCDDDLLRSRLTENLWEEGGGLAPDLRHSEIFRRFLRNGLGVDVDAVEYLDATRLFVDAYLDFCMNAHPAACAAFLSLGTEGIVGRMYGVFLDGLLRAGVTEEHTTFFRIHIACDDVHAETLEQIMLRYASMPDWIGVCRRAMEHALTLRRHFFEQIYEAIVARRMAGLLHGIQGGASLAPERPDASAICYRASAPALPLYANAEERLGIAFEVDRVPFESDVLDTRVLRVAPERSNELHKHPHESVFYVIAGRGRVRVNGSSVDVGPGDMVFVPRWATHQSHNTGDEDLVILAVTDFGLTERAYVGDHLETTRLRGTQAPRTSSAPAPRVHLPEEAL